MLNLLFILLGCHITYILNSRVQEAIKFTETMNETNTNVNWFLSGGIKNANEDNTVTEAQKMAEQLTSHRQLLNPDNKWNYILDTLSTNTVENFIMAKKHLDTNDTNYSSVYIITSKFHYNRAAKMVKRIFTNTPSNGEGIQWILADVKLEDSLYWEKIHIKNVDADVDKAYAKYAMYIQ
jgi:hypothetical protein